MKNKQKTKKLIFRIVEIVLAAVFLFGAGVLVYPFLNDAYYSHRTSVVIEDFDKQFYPDKEDGDDSVQSTAENKLTGLRKALEEYNNGLITGGQGKIVDVNEYSSFPVDPAQYEMPDSMIGYISIPAIDQELPLYLGASDENMANGATVLGQTSAPIGGVNTNCVIAAHNSWNGSMKFRYLKELSEGDKVYITNPWETLTYEVVSQKIIEPEDFNELLIQEGKDMLTLFTCHPYVVGAKHRLVVYAQRVAD